MGVISKEVANTLEPAKKIYKKKLYIKSKTTYYYRPDTHRANIYSSNGNDIKAKALITQIFLLSKQSKPVFYRKN